MKSLSNAAFTVLSSGVSIDGHELRITAGQLDRKVYVEVNAALEAIGGAWSRKAKAHIFAADPSDALDQILVDGGFSDKRRDFDQFFTPDALARLVVARADVRYKSVLEPSAGRGALARAAREADAYKVDCVELDAECVSGLQYDDFTVTHADFIKWSVVNAARYDVVVMNPPFSKQQDVTHVLTALSCLRTGGRLVAIMSAGVQFRGDRKSVAFREVVGSVGGVIEPLPEKSFASSGTNVNTVLVTLEKKS